MSAFAPKFREDQVAIVEAFIAHQVAASRRKGVVVGMSGGVDSALVAKLCADALGPRKVLALALPEGAGGRDLEDARSWAAALGTPFREIDIAPLVHAFESHLGARKGDRVSRGNLRPRVRMTILYYTANHEGRVVMGTGNKSEILTGYFTKMGDGGVDFLPIGDLYKTQVRAMAGYLGVPKRIVDKVPAAGLWAGQTDEAELGVPYDVLDRVLLGLELQLDPAAIADKAQVPLSMVDRVDRMVAASIHKRKMPLIPKVGIRTVGLDWRE